MAAAAKCQMNTTKISVHFLCASTESAQRQCGGDGNVDRNHDDYGESNNRVQECIDKLHMCNSSDLRQIHFRRATTYATKRVFQHIKYENTKAQSENVPRNVLPVVNKNCRATVVLDVLKRWKLETGPEGDKACSVWLSGKSLAAHLNLLVTTTAPDSIVSQALFIGHGYCAFFLTLYVRRALAANNENVDDVHDYTIEMVKRQTAALLDYSHSDLVILPCTIAVEDLTPERLQDRIDEEVQKVSHYYSGPLRLSEDVFREIQTAVTAISSETCLFWCLQTASPREPRAEELQSVLVLGGEEQRLLHLAIDHLANGDGNLPLTCRPEASLMTKAVLVEAAKRLGLRQKLSVRTQDDNILQSIRDIQDQSEEEYGVSSQLDASTDVEANVLSIQLISKTHYPDPVSSVLEWCSPADKDQDKLQDQLADFPHTFQLQNLQQMSTRQMKGLKSGLESALSVGYETGLETARARNLLAYVLWRLDRGDDALKQLDLVLALDDQSNNLVTLANKAVMLRRQYFVSSADDYVRHLRQLQKDCADFRYLVVKAKAELAFTYTRLGPTFIPDADTLFAEVIPEARDPEKWLWKFGLALNRRRKMRARPILFPSSTLGTAEVGEGRSLAQLLQEVVHSSASANLKAKTYAEMAIFLHMVWKKPMKSEIVIEIQMDPKQACERALELDSNDNSVLCKCGRIFRFFGETERSRELLEKALSIRPSSTGYHHLGLTYKCLAIREICKQPHRDSGSMQCPGKDAKAMKTAFNPR